MKVHIILTNKFHSDDVSEIDLKNCVCAVIDTIRATSTIATMLGCGGNSVVIADSKAEALKLKKVFNDFILCGEEGGLAPRGFEFNNSPVEISKMGATGKNFILMTTNGTQSIFKVRDCIEVFAISILNLHYTIDFMIDSAIKNSSDLLFLCSGVKGMITYDDAFTAGLAVKYILTRPYKFEYSDSAKLVLSAALCEFDIIDALEKSLSAKLLRSVGYGDDISFLSHLNKYRIAPKLSKLNIKKLKPRHISLEDLKSYLGYDILYLMEKGTK